MAVLLPSGIIAAQDFASPEWHCQHAIRTPWPPYPNLGTDECRGIAFSTNGNQFYVGTYAYDGALGAIFKMTNDTSATAVSQFTNNTTIRLIGYRGRSIAVDDKGRVYAAEGDGSPMSESIWWPSGSVSVTNRKETVVGINVFDPDLRHLLFSTDCEGERCEGVAVRRENGKLSLYATYYSLDELHRWEIQERGDAIIGATQCGLDGDGEVVIDDAWNNQRPRGLAIDNTGRIWIACAGNIWRCNSDGSHWVSADISTSSCGPLDLVCDGEYVFVSMRGRDRNSAQSGEIVIMNTKDMKIVATLSRPSANVTGVTGGTFMCLDTIPGSGRFIISMGCPPSGSPPHLLSDPAWKFTVMRLRLAPSRK